MAFNLEDDSQSIIWVLIAVIAVASSFAVNTPNATLTTTIKWILLGGGIVAFLGAVMNLAKTFK